MIERAGQFAPVLALLLLATPLSAGAGKPPIPDPAESQGDSAFARRIYKAAIRWYETSLSRKGLDDADWQRLSEKNTRAHRRLDEAVLASRRQALSAGQFERALYYGGYPDPDTRAEDLELIRKSAEGLIAAGRTEPVYRFLEEGFTPLDETAASVRAQLWRSLAAAYRPGTDEGIDPRVYARAVERAESLTASAPENRTVNGSLVRLKTAAAAYHSARAAELSQAHPAASYFHRRLARRYGASEDVAGIRADRAVLRLTRPVFRLSYPNGSGEPCRALTERLGAVLSSGEGIPVSVAFVLERCGPGRRTFEVMGESVGVAQSPLDVTAPRADRAEWAQTGRLLGQFEAPRAERDRRTESWTTYVVQGTATLTYEDRREAVPLDIHPRPRPGDTAENWVRAAAHEAVDAIHDGWRRVALGPAERFLEKAGESAANRQENEAEDAYATAILLLRDVPEPAARLYGERYGLRRADLLRCFPPDPLP